MKTARCFFGLALCFLFVSSSPVMAAEQSGVVFGNAYWSEFVDYWKGLFQQQNGIGMLIVAVGVVALIIITRGKWLK
jgi:hypothetical protein